MKVVWSPVAVEDFVSLISYITHDLDSPSAAKKLYQNIVKDVQRIFEVPDSGIVLHSIRGVDTGYRYVLTDDWITFYTLQKQEILVVRILYAKSNYLKVLLG